MLLIDDNGKTTRIEIKGSSLDVIAEFGKLGVAIVEGTNIEKKDLIAAINFACEIFKDDDRFKMKNED